jgi:glycopeptide antibiotics resistance protein
MGIIVCIETFQYFIGRSADVDDLIMNTIGGFIGYGIFALLNKCLNSKDLWQKVLG